MGEFRRRQFRLEDLSLALFDSTVVHRPMPKMVELSTGQSGRVRHVLPMFLFHRNSGTLYDCSLALCRDLLRTLESNKRELEVVRCFLEGILLPGLVTKVQPGDVETRARGTDEAELKGGELLEICRASFDHLPSGVGQVVPRLMLALSETGRADVMNSVQRFPQSRRVPLCAQLVDELENTTNVVVDLEYLHRQRGLKARKRSLLWRLCIPHWGFDIRQTGFDILKTHGGGVGEREQDDGACLIRQCTLLRIQPAPNLQLGPRRSLRNSNRKRCHLRKSTGSPYSGLLP